MAVLLTAAGCWEEIRYQPSESATRARREERKRDEREERRETETAEVDAAEAAAAVPAKPVAEPSEDELFGGDSEASNADDAGAVTGREPTAPVESAPTPEPAEAAVESSLPDGLPLTEAEPAVAPITPQERLDAWKAASGWSLAVAVAAKGLPADRYQPYLGDAESAAAAIGVELPPVPEVADGSDRETMVSESLSTGAGADLVSAIAKRLDASAGASARLAIDSHLLLLTYSTDGADAPAESLAASAEAAELPGRLWQPLVDLLAKDADFAAVRGAVFALHKSVAGYLEDAARDGVLPLGQ